MAAYLADHGVPADEILLEDRSTSPFENLTFSHTIMTGLDPKYRCLIVTLGLILLSGLGKPVF
jgi:uncharacterized SAM-binding protein YcdF (DUF218 family)